MDCTGYIERGLITKPDTRPSTREEGMMGITARSVGGSNNKQQIPAIPEGEAGDREDVSDSKGRLDNNGEGNTVAKGSDRRAVGAGGGQT